MRAAPRPRPPRPARSTRRSARAATSGATACSPRRAGRPTPPRGGSSARSCSPARRDELAHRLGRRLPPVRRAGRRAGRGDGVALHLADGSQILARRVGGPALAVSVGGTAASATARAAARLASPARGRLAADPRDELHRRRGRPLPPGVVHGPQQAGADELRPRDRRPSAARGAARAIVRLPGGSISVPPALAHVHRVLAARQRSAPGSATRPPTPPRARRSSRYWQRPPRRGDDGRRAGAAGDGRRARAARPGPAAHVALHHRQPVRGVLVPGGRRRRAGARRAGLRGRRARDPAHLAHAAGHARTRTGRWARSCSARPTHFRLFRDRAYLAQATPALRRYVATLGRQIDASPTGLLDRERYSSDIHDAVYGLHSQAVVWAGLRGMADAWAQTGQAALAARCRALAARLGPACGGPCARRSAGSRTARSSSRCAARRRAAVRLADRGTRRAATGTSSCPTRSPRGSSAGAGGGRLALHAAARLAPARARARRRLRALRARRAVPGLRHRPGLRDQRLALPRRQRRGRPARAEPLRPARCGDDARHVRRRRGRERRAAAGRASARCTCRRTAPRTPRSSRRCACCSCTRRRDGLELAYSTPRAWLAPGKRIAVTNAPTSFGPLSFSIEAHARFADVTVAAGPREPADAAPAPAAPRRQADRGRHARRPALPALRRDDRHDRPLGPHRDAAPPRWLSETSPKLRRACAASSCSCSRSSSRSSRLRRRPASGADLDRRPLRGEARREAGQDLDVHYRAHDGSGGRAYVVLPAWYGPKQHSASRS